MKRKLLVLMAVMMAAVSPAWAEDNDFIDIVNPSDGVRYNVYPADKHAELISRGSFTGADFVIQEKVEHKGVTYTVTKIVDNALSFYPYRNTSIKTIKIPKSIKFIGEKAFYGFTNLKTIYYNVEGSCDIHSNAFGDFVSFDELVIGEKVSEYPGYIMKCINPTNITIPDHITTLGKGAFSGCTQLTSITFESPNKLTDIEDYAFNGCTSLTSLTLPNSLKYVSQYAFNNCKSLTELTIPNSVRSIGASAFSGCDKLKTLYVLSSSEKPFYTSTLDGSPTDMEVYVREIAIGGFGSWVGRTVKQFSNIKYSTTGNEALGKTSLSDFGNTRFFADIYDGSNCGYLEFKGDVTNIPSNAFSGCKTLTEVMIPSTVSSIGENVFNGCSNLNKLYMLTTSAPSVSSDYFNSLPNLEVYAREKASDVFGSTWGGKTVNLLKNIHYTSSDGKAITPYNITGYGDNVNFVGSFYDGGSGNEFGYLEFTDVPTKIPNRAFDCNIYLTSIVLPNTTTEIGDRAFIFCTALSSINIPDGVTKIGKEAFSCCQNLLNLKLPESLETLGDKAFYSCTSLTEMTIPSTVTSFGDLAFAFSSSLATINVCNDEPATLGTDVFSGISYSYVINVPLNGYMDYKADSKWSALKLQTSAGKLELSDTKPYTIMLENDLDDCSLSYTRTVESDNWMGVCLPFDLDYTYWSAKGEAAILTAADGETLDWSIVQSGEKIEAGTPFIFKPGEAGEVTFSKTGATLHSCTDKHPATVGGYTLCGTYETVSTMASSGYYALSGNAFRRANNNGQTLNPYRVYIKAGSVQNAPARIRCRINGEDATGIEGVSADEADGLWLMTDGYNLSGQKVGKDYKGIVIVNGKKVLRK